MWGDPNAAQQEHEKGDRFTLEEAWNHRLIVRPIEYIADMPLRDTRGDAIKVNVVDLDDPSGPRLYRGALWFSGPIIKTFKNSIGVPFIGYPTKEPIPNSSYKRWVFISLASDPDTDARAQAWIAANPDFLDPIEHRPREAWGQPDTSHHEQGAPPAWAGAVPQRPPAPPAPPAAPRPPAPPAGYSVSAPPAPPVSAPPAAPGAATESVMERLRRQASQPAPFAGSGESGEQTPPF